MTTETPAPPKLSSKDKIFQPLPENIRTMLDTLPTPFNDREKRSEHLAPRMGRVIKAIRQVNGNISQKTLAEKQYEKEKGIDGKPFRTTHCQIATLEQGGCKKGANEQTVALLAHALKVEPKVVEAINRADLEERAERGDDQAKKILGIVEEGKTDTTAAAGAQLSVDEGDKDSAPEPSGSKAPSPEAKKTSVPTPQSVKDKDKAKATPKEPVKV